MAELRSDLGWSTADRVTVRGRDLAEEVLGHHSFGWVTFLHMTGREPTDGQVAVFDALLITLLEHGLTPSAMVARLTHLGAPESLQSAVAAGLLGLGDVFGGSAEPVARMLREAKQLQGSGQDVAQAVVDRLREQRRPIPGVGHPVHRPVDPRAERLWQLAREHELHGWYATTMQEIATAASEATGRSLPANATGAIGALACELDLPEGSERGLALIGRAAGLVGHVLEEQQTPMAREIWMRAEGEVTENALRD